MPKVSRQAMTKRDAAIVRARLMQHKSYLSIAAEFGVNERTARRAVRRWLDEQRQTLEGIDGSDVLAEMLVMYEGILESFIEIRDKASAEGKLGVMVSANNGIARTVERKAELMQAVGLLPFDLGAIQDEFDARWLFSVLWSVLIKHKVPKVVRDEIQQAIGDRLSRQRALPPGDAAAKG